VADDELLRITYGLERILTGEPDDNQLDVWDTRLERGDLGEFGTEPTWDAVATAMLYGMDPHRNHLLGEQPL
jgi:hypothetical protein